MILDKIKAVMAYKGKTQKDYADLLGTSKQNISNKFKRNSITANDMVLIAKMCDCKLIITDEKGFSVEFGPEDVR